MSQDTERYLYFKVGLLKDSFALEALWQDALRYHMIDQPAKLIAMRLTEYYELTKKGPVHSTESMPMPMASTASMPVPTATMPLSTAPAASMPVPTASAPLSTGPAVSGDKGNKEEIETPTSSSAALRPAATGSPVIRSVARPATPTLSTKVISTITDQAGGLHPEGELSLTVSSEVDQNAEEAADYWSLL